jgi:hypothetical protein
MINKENDAGQNKEVKESTYMDVVNVKVQAHILIKDKDTGEVLLNKRG